MQGLAELLNNSLKAYEEKRYKEADLLIDKLLKQDSQFEKALFLKAVICQETGREKEATNYFNRISNLPILWLRLGMQIEQRDMQRAVICYDNALKYNPLDNQALFLKGLLLEKRGQIAESKKCFEALNLKQDLVSKVVIPFGFFGLLSVSAYMLISRGEHGLSLIVMISAVFCLLWLIRDGGQIMKMLSKKISAKK